MNKYNSTGLTCNLITINKYEGTNKRGEKERVWQNRRRKESSKTRMKPSIAKMLEDQIIYFARRML